jgi:hypothetical protein
MSRRAFCSGAHSWKPSPRHPYRELCENCPATFPCRESCCHVDCEEANGRPPTCPTCRKPVTLAEGVHHMLGSKCVRLHDGACAERALAKLTENHPPTGVVP